MALQAMLLTFQQSKYSKDPLLSLASQGFQFKLPSDCGHHPHPIGFLMNNTSIRTLVISYSQTSLFEVPKSQLFRVVHNRLLVAQITKHILIYSKQRGILSCFKSKCQYH